MATVENTCGKSVHDEEIMIGVNHPLYLRLSDTSGEYLIEFKFSGTKNYNL